VQNQFNVNCSLNNTSSVCVSVEILRRRNGYRINKKCIFVILVTIDTVRWPVAPTGRYVHIGVTGTVRYCGRVPEGVIDVNSTKISTKSIFSSCEFHETRSGKPPKFSRDRKGDHIHVCTVQSRDILSVENALLRREMQHHQTSVHALKRLTVFRIAALFSVPIRGHKIASATWKFMRMGRKTFLRTITRE